MGPAGGTLSTGLHKARGGRLPYLPGLDGLRAVAVTAVLLYHAGLASLPGGFLGVEVFFVISGYLITTLLLAEWHARGRLSFTGFWLRRARRLLPALYVSLAATLVIALLAVPQEVASLRGDAAAAMIYVTNWYLIFSHKPYFVAMGRPSLLGHLWSLAVEEQFYLLWPLTFAGGMRILRRRGMPAALLAGAVASATLMAALYRPGSDPSRIYYGTDTRAAGLLLGAALAFLWAPGSQVARLGRAGPPLLDAAGLASLAVLAWAFARLDEFQPALYRGGFALVALATAVAIAAVVGRRSRLGQALGLRPLVWVGLRSYSIYLWHWPVFALTRPQLDLPIAGLPLLALRLAVTTILAELSYRHVETPIRRGALGHAWLAWRAAAGPLHRRLRTRWAAMVGLLLAASVTLGFSVASARTPAPPQYLAVESIHLLPESTIPPSVLNAQTPAPARAVAAASHAGMAAPTSASLCDVEPDLCHPRRQPRPSPRPTSTPSPTAAVPPTPTPTRAAPAGVLAIGDSVMLGAAGALQRALVDVEVDASVSRQVGAAITLLRARRDAGSLSPIIVVHLGNNGGFSREQFDELMEVLAGTRRVVFLNLKVPRRWQEPNNAVIAEGVLRYPAAVLVDWHKAGVEHPGYFWEDGIHLRQEGADAYAGLVAAAVQGAPEAQRQPP